MMFVKLADPLDKAPSNSLRSRRSQNDGSAMLLGGLLFLITLFLWMAGYQKRQAALAMQPPQPTVTSPSPTPTTTPSPTPAPIHPFKKKICQVFGEECENAWKVVSQCENKSLNPKSIHHNKNGSIDVGLFQINSIHGYSTEYLQNVDNNIQVAYQIFKKQGWSAWSCSWVLGIKPFYKR